MNVYIHIPGVCIYVLPIAFVIARYTIQYQMFGHSSGLGEGSGQTATTLLHDHVRRLFGVFRIDTQHIDKH